MMNNFYHIAVLGAECSGKSTFLRKMIASQTYFLNFLSSLKYMDSFLKQGGELFRVRLLSQIFEQKPCHSFKKIVIFEGVRRFVEIHQRPPMNHEEQYKLGDLYLKLSLFHQMYAKNQIKNHDANIVNICFSDTTPLLTAIYSDYYLSPQVSENFENQEACEGLGLKEMRLWHLALQLHQNQKYYDAVLVFPPNIPWRQDEGCVNTHRNIQMRDSAVARQKVFDMLIQYLDAFKINYLLPIN